MDCFESLFDYSKFRNGKMERAALSNLQQFDRSGVNKRGYLEPHLITIKLE
jgi:hypothetical protein